MPFLANSADPDLKKQTDLDPHCLPLSIWIYTNDLDQVIWLAENKKWARHFNWNYFRLVQILFQKAFGVQESKQEDKLEVSLIQMIVYPVPWMMHSVRKGA